MGQADGKYWIANNPNAQVSDAQAQAIAGLDTSELAVLDVIGDTTATAAELNLLDDQVANAVISVAAEGTEAIIVSIQLNDAAGTAMTSARCLYGYLSADSAGQTAASSSGLTITSGTDGLTQILIDSNTQNNFLMTSEADGDIDVVITDASGGTTTNYLNVVMPSGKIVTSAAITFA